MVSIGMPVYNAEKYIAFAIQSVLNQTFTNFELIIFDDGSTDNTIAIIKSFNDKRIKFYHHEYNAGIAICLNQVIKFSSGTYFARMDADDIMFPDRLMTQVEFLNQNPSFDVIGSNAVIINEKNCIIGLRKIKEYSTFYHAMKSSVFIHPTIMGHLNWFKDNLYDIDLSGAEDYDLFFRTFFNSKFKNLQEPVLFYRETNDSKTSNYTQRLKIVVLSIKKNSALINNRIFVFILIMFINFKSLLFCLSFKLKFKGLFIKFRNSKLSIESMRKYQVLISNQCC